MSYEFRPNMKFLRFKAVMEITGLCRAEIDRRRIAGTFPKPIQLGPRQIAWPSYAIEEWQKEVLAETGAKTTRERDESHNKDGPLE